MRVSSTTPSVLSNTITSKTKGQDPKDKKKKTTDTVRDRSKYTNTSIIAIGLGT